MKQGIQDSRFEKLLIGLMAAVIAGIGTLVVEVLDFWIWDIGWVEADSLVEYLHKTWYVPVAFAALALGIGIWKGVEALDFAWGCWKD